jgi:hypothetical protein
MAMNENRPGGGNSGPERDAALDRLYREGGSEGPPAHLDAAILAAAHREVGARPRARPGALRRWQVPLSIAAVVVLSVSLVTLVQEEGGEQLMQPSPPPVAPSVPGSQRAPTQAEQPGARSTPPATPRQSEPVAKVSPSGPADTGSLSREAASDAGPAASQQGLGAAIRSDDESRSQPQPFRDAPETRERRATAPPAPPAEDAAAVERQAAPAVAPPAAKPLADRSRAAQARKESATGETRPVVWQGYENEPPQKWLDRIAELRRTGRASDAEAMLAEFRRRFPAHPVPVELH